MPNGKRFVIVFVVDGVRPDAITPELTPTLFRLRSEGVNFTNGHSVFPTVTRVNAAAIGTGMQPGSTGILGNQMFAAAVDARRALDIGNHRRLLELEQATGGRVVLTETLGERLHARGLSLASVSSGSTGSALLTNARAPRGIGVLVNGAFEPGKLVAWPAEVNAAILAKFGPAPARGALPRYDAVVTWTEQVLREYVLPDLAPDVVINWLTEPDHSQHHLGAGSPSSLEALANDDREIARVLETLDELGLTPSTDVLVVSDHGFTTNTRGVDVAGALIEAGLKAAPDSGDVVLASSGQAVAVHVEGHDRDRVAAIARFIQASEWGGVLFSRARAAGDAHGVVDGTFSLELIHVANAERGPDLLFTFPWTSDANAFGVPGTDLASISGGAKLYVSDHGSMSPWNVRNTFLAWGADFKKRTTVGTPVGTVDVVPTILALLGLADDGALDGRVVTEALDGGPDPERIVVNTHVHGVEIGAYRAAIQTSEIDGRRYIDKSWRVR
jgi:arylsulfatase A-like enzyme